MTAPVINSGKPPASTEAAEKIQNWALFYVQRYGCTCKTLESYLNRKVSRFYAQWPELVAQLKTDAVPAALNKMIGWGYLNDATYARGLARRLLREGRAPAFIRQRLQEKGVPAAMVDDACAELAADMPGDMKLAGAVRLMQRRRLGCFGGRHADAPQKAFGVFARAGFDYAVAKQALGLSREEADELLAPLNAL